MSSVPASRGDHTRDAIIRAATDVFGRVGYDAASTRAISQAAGTNQALISYHFGGKEGLYQAVIDGIAAEMEDSLVPVLDEIQTAMPMRGRSAVEAMLSLFSALMGQFNRVEASGWSRIIAREQQDPTAAFEIIYNRYMSRVLDTLSALIAGASGDALAEQAARTRAILMMGQILVFIFSREAARRFLGWTNLEDGIPEDVFRELKSMVYAQFPEPRP
ncbi:MAG: CerR family C-terminal domain-containing protein [Pseudomonadota bacterium]